jgi:hypothetical protein
MGRPTTFAVEAVVAAWWSSLAAGVEFLPATLKQTFVFEATQDGVGATGC